MNAVILTSVVSAGNHALFAGTRVLYSLASAKHAPPFFAWTTQAGVPLPALLATSSISALCFGSSFVGSGALWGWLQNFVGVSNQVRHLVFFVCNCSVLVRYSWAKMSDFKIAWVSIGIASWRFRKAWVQQGRPLEELKFRSKWTWGWGPPFVVRPLIGLSSIKHQDR